MSALDDLTILDDFVMSLIVSCVRCAVNVIGEVTVPFMS